MKYYPLMLLYLFLSCPMSAQNTALFAQKKVMKLMGSRFEITVVAESKQTAWNAINAGIKEIERIEKLISSWNPNSQTALINRMAGIEAVKVDKELYDLVYRSKKISALTDGAFDISFSSMDKIWAFDGSMTEMPAPTAVAKARAKINWQNIILDSEKQSIFLREKGMKISFGAIGKGYAANKVKALIRKMKGIHGGLVNASGDLTAWGKNPAGKAWLINITNPKDKEVALGWLQIQDGAVVTSGDYERFAVFEGKRYGHIIDPRTGYPTTGIKSVTIVCPDTELADALATSVFVLNREKGLQLINRLKDIECLIVTDEDEIFTSKNIKINYF